MQLTQTQPTMMELHQSLLIHCVQQVQRAASLSSISHYTPGDSGLLNNVKVASSDRHKGSRSTVEVAQSGPLGQMDTVREQGTTEQDQWSTLRKWFGNETRIKNKESGLAMWMESSF